MGITRRGMALGNMREQDKLALSELKDSQKGKSAFIFGTGASLDQAPDHVLEWISAQDVVIASNFFMLWDRAIIPTHYVTCEEEWFTHFGELVAQRCPDAVKVFTKNHPPHMYPRYGEWTFIYRHHDIDVVDYYADGVPEEFDGWATGLNVTLDAAIPLALHMGCTRLFLIGVDGGGDSVYSSDDRDRWAEESGIPRIGDPPVPTVYGDFIERIRSLGESLMSSSGIRLINASYSHGLPLLDLDLTEFVDGKIAEAEKAKAEEKKPAAKGPSSAPRCSICSKTKKAKAHSTSGKDGHRFRG